jgi:DNA polymerase V|tara:strand:- start:263 stop:670 length:408 start_codon:yes stop_codon:yes gene_type:complete
MLIFITPSTTEIKLFNSKVSAGFPSPADDYIEESLSLDELLIKHPSATYMVKAQGNSMIGAGIYDGDILIIDRALTATTGDIVIASIDGEFTCKYLNLESQELRPANPRYSVIKIKDDIELLIEGVVTSSMRMHR